MAHFGGFPPKYVSYRHITVLVVASRRLVAPPTPWSSHLASGHRSLHIGPIMFVLFTLIGVFMAFNILITIIAGAYEKAKVGMTADNNSFSFSEEFVLLLVHSASFMLKSVFRLDLDLAKTYNRKEVEKLARKSELAAKLAWAERDLPDYMKTDVGLEAVEPMEDDAAPQADVDVEQVIDMVRDTVRIIMNART